MNFRNIKGFLFFVRVFLFPPLAVAISIFESDRSVLGRAAKNAFFSAGTCSFVISSTVGYGEGWRRWRGDQQPPQFRNAVLAFRLLLLLPSANCSYLLVVEINGEPANTLLFSHFLPSFLFSCIRPSLSSESALFPKVYRLSVEESSLSMDDGEVCE